MCPGKCAVKGKCVDLPNQARNKLKAANNKLKSAKGKLAIAAAKLKGLKC